MNECHEQHPKIHTAVEELCENRVLIALMTWIWGKNIMVLEAALYDLDTAP